MDQFKLDGQGYPEEESLDRISAYTGSTGEQARELIMLLREIWWMPDWGFIWDGKSKLILHTGGWSGNEDIIRALKSSYFWMMYWRAHFTGGHFHFEIK